MVISTKITLTNSYHTHALKPAGTVNEVTINRPNTRLNNFMKYDLVNSSDLAQHRVQQRDRFGAQETYEVEESIYSKTEHLPCPRQRRKLWQYADCDRYNRL